MSKSQKCVLVCDDSLLMRKLVCDSLAADDWYIAGEAVDGAQAIEMFKQLRPSAVTMDIVMPGTDGITALRGILEFDPDAKVVIVSALAQTKAISEAIRAGAQDFIVKPFMPEQLQETLDRCHQTTCH